MQETESSVQQNPEAELADDSERFNKSLQELKDLCSQLHYAADYCESSFLNAECVQKKKVMENTKEYLCRAVITAVDHLGSVSASLDHLLSMNNTVPETEFRINGLKERLVTYQQCSQKLSLTRLSWHANFPRFHPRYIIPPRPDVERSDEVPVATKTISKHEFKTEEDVPLFLYTFNHKPSITKDSATKTSDRSPASVLPVRDGLSLVPKVRNPSFHFQGTPRLKRNMLNWRLVQNNDILSLIRKSKRPV